MAKIRNFKKGPEAIIQSKIVFKLRGLQWSCRETHGNLFSFGWPDIYAANRTYGTRWIEVKDPSRKGDIFTAAQHEYFSELTHHRVGIWVLTSDHDSEIAKLFSPPNWTHYLDWLRP